MVYRLVADGAADAQAGGTQEGGVKVALHIDGHYEVELQPETQIERAVLEEIAARADRGQPVRIQARADKGYAVGVENS